MSTVYVVGDEAKDPVKGPFRVVAFQQGLKPEQIAKLLHPEDELRHNRKALTDIQVLDTTVSLWIKRWCWYRAFDVQAVLVGLVAVGLFLHFGESPLAIWLPSVCMLYLLLANQALKIIINTWWHNSIYALLGLSSDAFGVLDWVRSLIGIACFIRANPLGRNGNLKLAGRGQGESPISVWEEKVVKLAKALHNTRVSEGMGSFGSNKNLTDVITSLKEKFAPWLYTRLEYGLAFRDYLFCLAAFLCFFGLPFLRQYLGTS